ncbi:uncharacterized protein LOC130799327 [Amaranthus tricolor]|uniref:uncharacterized protein LOC130799327 n=1 Tax=Amaranthus tricolor TaxID=29722 RepID=UPI00258E00F2|nr:uncharacterized protein LOC130799327 [Amaranthus tricolor]
MFVIDQDKELWDIISKGPKVPMKKDAQGNDVVKSKSESEYSQSDLESVSKNYRAINQLCCTLNGTEFNRVSSCKSPKEIWDKLLTTHELTLHDDGGSDVTQAMKNLALKAKKHYESSSEDEESDDEEYPFALIIRGLERIMKMRKRFNKFKSGNKGKSSSSNSETHKLSDSEGSTESESQDGQAHLCLMANDDKDDDLEQNHKVIIGTVEEEEEMHKDDRTVVSKQEAMHKDEKQKWILDSRCLRHMSGKLSLYSEIKERCNGSITLGDKGKNKILGVGKVGKDASKIIDNVYLVGAQNFKCLKAITDDPNYGIEDANDLHKDKKKNMQDPIQSLDELNEDGNIIRNKERLVAQGYNQQEEEVYVKQPSGFENPDLPNHLNIKINLNVKFLSLVNSLQSENKFNPTISLRKENH